MKLKYNGLPKDFYSGMLFVCSSYLCIKGGLISEIVNSFIALGNPLQVKKHFAHLVAGFRIWGFLWFLSWSVFPWARSVLFVSSLPI